MRIATAFSSLALGLLTTNALAANYDEAVDGDLSTDAGTPTFIDFDVGSNIVSGDMISPNDTRDYLTFTLESNERLVGLVLLAYTDIDSGGPGDRGYIAINAGNTSEVPGGGNVDFFLGGDHLDPDIGVDLLPILAMAPLAGTGFDIPLGPGDYSVVIQQTGTEFTGWSVDFQVAAVPVPAALWLFGAGLLSLAGLRRRQR